MKISQEKLYYKDEKYIWSSINIFKYMEFYVKVGCLKLQFNDNTYSWIIHEYYIFKKSSNIADN